MVKAADFIRQVMIPLSERWGYIYGTWGVLWTKERQALATRDMTVKYGARWIGHMVTDCSGLIRWALYQLGENIAHHARYQYTDWSAAKGRLIDGRREDGTLPLPGTAVFLKGSQAHIHHVGVYVGGGICVEAKGTVYGVVTSHLNHWDYWGELKMIDYTDAASLESAPDDAARAAQDAAAGTIVHAVVDNPNRWLNVHSGPGSIYPVQFQLEKGTVVEILDAGEPDWWQLRAGSRIGWAAAQYLSLTDPPDDDDAPVEPSPMGAVEGPENCPVDSSHRAAGRQAQVVDRPQGETDEVDPPDEPAPEEADEPAPPDEVVVPADLVRALRDAASALSAVSDRLFAICQSLEAADDPPAV